MAEVFEDATKAHAAAFAGNRKFLSSLVKSNSDMLRSKTSDGETPAHHAAAAGRDKVLTLLGTFDPALLEATDNDGWNCAHMSAFYGHLSALKAVSQHSPSAVLAKDSAGRMPVDLSSNSGCITFLKALARDGFTSPMPSRVAAEAANAASAAPTPEQTKERTVNRSLDLKTVAMEPAAADQNNASVLPETDDTYPVPDDPSIPQKSSLLNNALTAAQSAAGETCAWIGTRKASLSAFCTSSESTQKSKSRRLSLSQTPAILLAVIVASTLLVAGALFAMIMFRCCFTQEITMPVPSLPISSSTGRILCGIFMQVSHLLFSVSFLTCLHRAVVSGYFRKRLSIY